jgi:predicted outer membrane protein
MPNSPRNEAQFRRAIAGPAALSLTSSQLATRQATNSGVRQFATFELSEMTNASTVLRDMGTPLPAPDAAARALMQRLGAARGVAFDRAYIQSQLQTHILLRSLVQNFLANSRSNAMPERHARHIAMVMLPAINEHISHTQQLSLELGR